MKKCPLCEGTGFLTRKGEGDKEISFIKNLLKLREKGLSYREIAALVGLSANTVHYHISKYSK